VLNLGECDTWCSATAFPYSIGFSGFVTSTFMCVVVVVIEPCPQCVCCLLLISMAFSESAAG
jgi:hypothetical protein